MCDNLSLIMVIGLKHVWLVNECAVYMNSYIFMILLDMCMQQNSCNLVSNNPEILIIQCLRWVVPRLEIVLFTRKKLQQWNRCIQKRPSRMSVCQPLQYLLALVSCSNVFNCEDSQKTQKRTLMTLNQQMKEITMCNTPLFSCIAQVYAKNCL
jgi:hypothetical protein